MSEQFHTPPELESSALTWRSILAGAVAAAALTLVLLTSASLGLSAASPWSDSGVSARTFQIATGLYLVVTALISSTVGGYLNGRLRTKWKGIHSYEVQFRDTAHGFLAWALATVMGAAVLSGAAAYLVGGAATGAPQGRHQMRRRPPMPTIMSPSYCGQLLTSPLLPARTEEVSPPLANKHT